MDYFGRERLRELLDPPEGPAVSIYLPTHRSSSEAETDRLRFRAALDEARELLAGEDGAGPTELLEDLEPMARRPEFWRYQADGLALFVAPGFQRMYRVPSELPELVVVGPSFHTRPLIEHLQAPDRYWVLGLSQKEVRIWEGTARGLTPMDLRGVPADFREALDYEFERDYKIVQRHKKAARSHGGRGTGGGWSPIFHGHGTGSDDSEPELRRFYRKVDRGMADLLEDEIGPLVLATTTEQQSIYRSVSRAPNLVEEGIHASVMDWSEERLHEEAWPVARREALKQVDRALELWEGGFGQGKSEADLANLGRLAVAGRLRLLLTERDRRVWGTLDRETGRLELLREGGDDPGEHAVDLLDELAEITLLRGGRALVLSEERMPTGTGAAGVLR